jgi:CheY-like chemotaxis protein
MPVMDGLEATRTIKGEATTRDIPVIATTASAMQGDEDRAIQAGCDGYLTKPIDIKELLNKVEGYLSAKQHKSDYSETGG